MDKFESSFDKLDLTTATMEGAMGSAMATSAPTSAVDALIRQVRAIVKNTEFISDDFKVADENELDVANMLDAAPEQKARYVVEAVLRITFNSFYSIVSPRPRSRRTTNSKVVSPLSETSQTLTDNESGLTEKQNVKSLQ